MTPEQSGLLLRRNGTVMRHGTPIRSLDEVHGAIHANVEAGSQLYTDDHMVFNDLDGHTFERLDSFVDAIVGKRLTYARLIAKVSA